MLCRPTTHCCTTRQRADLAGDALQYLDSTTARFDLVFIDPPYRSGWLDRLLPRLERVTTAATLLYVEAENPVTRFGPWHRVRYGTAGEVHYQLLQQDTDPREARLHLKPLNHRIAIYPGTFDPITRGHRSLVRRAASLFRSPDPGHCRKPGQAAAFQPG